MKRSLIDDSLWFVHQDGGRFYPWIRHSKYHDRSSFWVSGGSNHIKDATAVATISDLVVEVFSKGRSVWLSDNAGRTGLYRFGHDAIQDWGASEAVRPMVLRAHSPAAADFAASPQLPALVTKALTDTGYDLIASAGDGWATAEISGRSGRVLLRSTAEGVLVAVASTGMAQRIGLEATQAPGPHGMSDVGIARGGRHLYEALRVLHSLHANPIGELSERVEARLAAIPATERTREVRQRIGQDVFREALFDLWQGRCALSGLALHPALLRASHAKPWASSTDPERLDPFNGLLLAVHYDALFDKGLIAFEDNGRLISRPELSVDMMSLFRVEPGMQLRGLLPGHIPYLRQHRLEIARLG